MNLSPLLLLPLTLLAQSTPPRINQIGAYGPWLADTVLGDGPANLSFRTGKWKSVEEWRKVAKARALERIAPVNLGGVPKVTVTGRTTYDGLDIEFLTWQLPMGPKTEAVLLKPSGAKGRLPGILALHDHGGMKFLGWRKIVRTSAEPWTIQQKHQAQYYGGVGWANEIAKRGYVVLVHDTFPFASRRVRVADVPERLRAGGVDPAPEDEEGVAKYNRFAREHEDIMEKSLISAGTTWPGVYLVEDQRALDVLAARSDVDPTRLGCGGLSGGGMRTVFLGGLDERIKVAIAVGFMTTWREFLLDKAFTHTWMTYVPLLPKDLDFPEILALRAPAATMVLNCRQDQLYTMPEMERADRMIAETFRRANASDRYKSIYYEGGHKFDREMQSDAFAWFDRFLKQK
ncbi:MAG: prolyl oligopeptidase family serine peptidase [Acidobacteria bacterium]|nr:prolyl oligopeptidase family serine peptidase [Acidobacteriota bacterium]